MENDTVNTTSAENVSQIFTTLSTESQFIWPEIRQGDEIQSVLNGFSMAIGLLCNPLVLLVCCSSTFRTRSTYRIIAAIAVADFFVNWSYIFLLLLEYGTNGNFQTYVMTTVSCKLSRGLSTACTSVSSWLHVMVMIERLLYILVTLKMHKYSRQVALGGTLVVVILGGALTFILGYVAFDYTGSSCDTGQGSLSLWNTIYAWIPIVVQFCICGVLMFHLLTRSERRTTDYQQRKFDRMFVFLGVLMLLLYLPAAVQLEVLASITDKSSHLYAKTYLVYRGIFQPIQGLFHAIKFPIYVAFLQEFRERFVDGGLVCLGKLYTACNKD